MRCTGLDGCRRASSTLVDRLDRFRTRLARYPFSGELDLVQDGSLMDRFGYDAVRSGREVLVLCTVSQAAI